MHPLPGRYCPQCGQPTDLLFCPIDNSSTIADEHLREYIPTRWREIERNTGLSLTRPIALTLIALEDTNGIRLSASPRVQTSKQLTQEERRMNFYRWLAKEGRITEYPKEVK